VIWKSESSWSALAYTSLLPAWRWHHLQTVTETTFVAILWPDGYVSWVGFGPGQMYMSNLI